MSVREPHRFISASIAPRRNPSSVALKARAAGILTALAREHSVCTANIHREMSNPPAPGNCFRNPRPARGPQIPQK
eukprot:2254003-Amphidinium_carterae.1